jgi:hypothetical protein
MTRLHALKAKLFDDLLLATENFEGDEEINGGDFVEAFARFRISAVERIREVERARSPSLMSTYVVVFRDHGMSSRDEPLEFRCEAEDYAHAEGQCLDNYPAAHVLTSYRPLLKTLIALYRDDSIKAGDAPLAFKCQAEDTDHAEEQCENAYPDCDVVWVVETDDVDEAYGNYWGVEHESE